MNKLTFLISIILIAMSSVSCKEEVSPRRDPFGGNYMSHVFPGNFVAVIDNPYLTLKPGSSFTFRSQTDEGVERVEVEVLNDTKVIMGITCTVVRDKVYLEGELVEDTFDWFAQDKDGNVWYMGERVDNYEGGVVANHYGSWEAGVDGAEPGVIMLADPAPGLYYRQEHYIGEAEDQAEVTSTNEVVTVAAGTFTGCIKIRETNPLDPAFLEFKYYAKGIGLVKVEKQGNAAETEELISYTTK